jgi:hypothetical protein
MPAESSIIVCKPQVPFSQRLIDPGLRGLTVTQLRRKARDNALDVSRLTEKWEFVHVLVQHRTHGVQAHLENVTDNKRHTIFDLPGEIRNKIYGYVLVDDEPIVARYEPKEPHLMTNANRLHRMLSMYIPDPRTMPDLPKKTSQLLNMSWKNCALRKEVRSFFFANNRFEVRGDKGSSYVNFLNDIGPDGRANIAVLDLDGARFWMYNLGFRSALAQCTNLRDLTIRMHVGHLLRKNTYDEIRDYVKSKSNTWLDHARRIEVSSTINTFTLVPALKVLKVVCAIPAWDYRNGSQGSLPASSRLSTVEGDILDTVSRALRKVIAGTSVKITVTIQNGAPGLSGDT